MERSQFKRIQRISKSGEPNIRFEDFLPASLLGFESEEAKVKWHVNHIPKQARFDIKDNKLKMAMPIPVDVLEFREKMKELKEINQRRREILGDDVGSL